MFIVIPVHQTKQTKLSLSDLHDFFIKVLNQRDLKYKIRYLIPFNILIVWIIIMSTLLLNKLNTSNYRT